MSTLANHQQRALARGAALVLGMALLPAVSARQCWFDDEGFEHCNDDLSTGARIGIAIGVFVIGTLLLIAAMLTFRRRRARRDAAAVYVSGGPMGAPGQGAGRNGYAGAGGPSYPPQTYSNFGEPGYGYAPQGPPPPQYAPPPGMPPNQQQHWTDKTVA